MSSLDQSLSNEKIPSKNPEALAFIKKEFLRVLEEVEFRNMEAPGPGDINFAKILQVIKEQTGMTGEYKEISDDLEGKVLNDIGQHLTSLKEEGGKKKYDAFMISELLSSLEVNYFGKKKQYDLEGISNDDLNEIDGLLKTSHKLAPLAAEISELLQEKMSTEEKEKKLLRYATDGYRELYAKYKKEGDLKRLEQLQDIVFRKNVENGSIELYFNKLGFFLSEPLLGFKGLKESKKVMDGYDGYYGYPTGIEFEKIINVCPGESKVEDMEIFSAIMLGNHKWYFIEKSFGKETFVFGVGGTAGDNKYYGEYKCSSDASSFTIGIRHIGD